MLVFLHCLTLNRGMEKARIKKRINRLSVTAIIFMPLPAFEWVTTICCGSSHSGFTPRRAASVKGGEAAEPGEGDPLMVASTVVRWPRDEP